MPVAELAILRLPSTALPSSLPETLASSLKQAKDAMESFSGYKFYYLRSIDDPAIVYIVGCWPSVEFHMNEWIPSRENQDLLKSLGDQLSVETMFHVDIDQTKTPLPMVEGKSSILTIGRHHIKSGMRDEFTDNFQRVRRGLDESVGGKQNVVGGFRIDRQQQEGQEQEEEEFVLFTRWPSEEKYSEFVDRPESVAGGEYASIREYLQRVDIKRVKILDA